MMFIQKYLCLCSLLGLPVCVPHSTESFPDNCQCVWIVEGISLHNPDASVPPEDLYHSHTSTLDVPNGCKNDKSSYSNKTVELVMDWQNTGSSVKSNEEVDWLVHNVIFHPNFDPDDL